MRSLTLLLALPFVFGVSSISAQTKKPGKIPGPKDPSISVNVFMRDANKHEVLVGTRIWPGYPEYNALALQRFFAAMKMLEPDYKQDDDVAYTWSTKGGKVTKCSIYLESADAGAKTGTGAIVGCEANGVSMVPVVSITDAKHVSSSDDPKHLNDVMELFNKQSERARNSLPKK